MKMVKLRFLPVLAVFMGFGGAACAEPPDNPWLAEGAAGSLIEACLVAASSEEEGGDAPRQCSDAYFTACAEQGDWTTHAMNQCQGAALGYWEGVAKARERAVFDIEDQRLTDYVEVSGVAYAAYREARCQRFLLPMGTMYLQMYAACLTETTMERAADLADFLGEQPLIVPEPD
ncbi:MAG: lysozyme inhibitor LprI family protein [Parvibaculum sp.]|uniref:lysozyme inhibitor LprI family protein n=1 Tax=Parvibaculum sp. TaxID=2024848 RepID=UPI0027270E0E|nr:lysozyme inhibitor LprI family protein [Parvibaculum sp.]MDO8839738.1 lysozyme inhibitor LprI family protein [Parvibaculum sp.]